MPLPDGMTTCTYTFGTDLDFRGDSGAIRVTIEPDFGDANHLVWQPTGAVLSDAAIEADAAAGQTVSIELPHVDQDGWLTPDQQEFKDFSYRATVVARRTDGTERVRYKTLQPVAGQDDIDADFIPSAETASPTYGARFGIPTIGGYAGAVTLGPGVEIDEDGVLTASVDPGEVGDLTIAAVLEDTSSETRLVLEPIIDERAALVPEEESEINPVLIYANVRSQ